MVVSANCCWTIYVYLGRSSWNCSACIVMSSPAPNNTPSSTIRNRMTEIAEANGLAIPRRFRKRASGSIIRNTKNDKNTGAASRYTVLKANITRYTVSTTKPMSNMVRQYFLYSGNMNMNDSFLDKITNSALIHCTRF
ncbi:hypothetical protein D3C74_400710 [compost metagenome]